jgi:hypothetical protein
VGNYKHLVKNTALLAAVDYGLFKEVRYLLHTHPSGTPFMQMNSALLERAVESGGKDGAVTKLIYSKLNYPYTSLYHIPEKETPPDSSPQVDEEPRNLSSLIDVDVEEVKEAIKAVMFL